MPTFTDRPPLDRRQLLVLGLSGLALDRSGRAVAPPDPSAWVRQVTCLSFGTPGEADKLADLGAEVMHTNLGWPYYPLRKQGGSGLPASEGRALRLLVRTCRRRGMRLVLGLPPFMPVALARRHPDWREQRRLPIPQVPATVANDLGSRSGCNLGPWGDYLVDLCAEMASEYDLDGFSFDGNYHPPICYCPACEKAYRGERERALPARAHLDDVAYREYLVWRGQKLLAHYEKLRARVARARPGAVIMSWTVNAGRYGHFLHSPRAMPIEVNRVFEIPMQEWWLDESNQGASVVPAFGVAYQRAVAGDRPCASEPYLMSRARPMGTDSFPQHERRTRGLLALTHGSVAAHSVGWPGHAESTRELFTEAKRLRPWLIGARRLPWAGLLVSESTRQLVAYADIAGRFLPPVLGAFRACLEEHLPISLLTDLDVTDEELARHRVLILPDAVALSTAQAETIRSFVRAGGGLVATGETSLADELGRRRKDFALADLFGVSWRGREVRTTRLEWGDHQIVSGDERLRRLVPTRAVAFHGPVTRLAGKPAELAWQCRDGSSVMPGAVVRKVGKGQVVYLATGIDAALWSHSYPYQRVLLSRAIRWAAGSAPPPVEVQAPLCVQVAAYEQPDGGATRRRVVIHLFNGLNTSAHHGQPGTEVPLREETVPIHDIRIRFNGAASLLPRLCAVEPKSKALSLRREEGAVVAVVPRLELHTLVVARY